MDSIILCWREEKVVGVVKTLLVLSFTNNCLSLELGMFFFFLSYSLGQLNEIRNYCS